MKNSWFSKSLETIYEYIKNHLCLIILSITMVGVVTPANAYDVTVDAPWGAGYSDSANWNSYRVPSGGWIRFTGRNGDTATFEATLTTEGNYDVSYAVDCFSNADNNAQYEVTYANGDVLYPVNQIDDCGGYIELGNHCFDPSQKAKVNLVANHQSGDYYTVADKIKFTLTSAESCSAPTSYNITSSATTGGSIDPDGTEVVAPGGTQSYSITTDTGYEISDVVVDGSSVGTVTSYTFSNVDDNHTIIASFSPIIYTISGSSGAGGTISPSGNVDVSHGENQTFTITPNTGYEISNVVVDGSSVGASSWHTFTNVVSDHDIRASFTPMVYTISASADTGGTISPSGDISVTYGGGQSFTISPETGYSIYDVTVDGTSVGAVTSYDFIDVSANHSINASFISYTIIATASANGVISPSGDVIVGGGADQTFSITPNTGYVVGDVVVDGNSVIDTLSDEKSYTFYTISEDHTIYASFIEGFEIAVSAGDGGEISPSGGNNGIVFVEPGADVAFTVIADSCNEIEEVIIDDDVSIGAVQAYDGFQNVNANHSISASFTYRDEDLQLISTSGVNTTITPEGETVVNCGGDQDFEITYDIALQDLFIVVNGEAIRLVKDGEQQSVTNVVSTGGNSLTFSLEDIYDDYQISLNEVFNISNFPLDIQTRPAPPNIMFVLDDSGSMDWEFMTTESDGIFSGNYYIFNDPGDNVYDNRILDSGERAMWKSQWSNYNKLYYDPSVDYEVWPEITPDDLSSSLHVRSHPGNTTHTLNLSSTFTTIDSVTIPNAHYYVEVDSTIYLVVMDSTPGVLRYYKVEDTENGTGSTQKVDDLVIFTPVTGDGIKSERTYSEEIQNFANWYTFYRKRELAATMAVSSVIDQITNTYVGIRTINSNGTYGIQKELTPLEVLYLDTDDEYVYLNEKSTLLTALYDLDINSYGTPLRRGLEHVGDYFDQTVTANGSLSGNPWFSDELGGECQQSFAIVMTDGFWNGDNPDVDNADGTKGKPYADTHSNTLADVAMYYFDDHDLVDDGTLGDLVPGENSSQHLNTYSVAFGVNGSLGDSGNYTLVAGCDEAAEPSECNYPEWPDPTDGNSYKIDDLFHAGVNGRGLYLNASDPTELVDSLLSAIKDIADANGSSASISVNGDELFVANDGDLLLYQTQYQSPEWTGNVYAYELEISASSEVTLTEKWDAGDLLDTALSNGENTSSRLIATLKDDPAAPNGVAFKDVTVLTTTQQEYFNDGNDSTTAQELLDYIRGSSAKESTTLYRERDSRLGDIVHSAAIHVENYLYVGANDGMLHAFDSDTGAEKFSYIPNLVMSNLKNLTDQNYGDSHLFFVDNSPYALEMSSNAEDTAGQSKTYLVGGLGKGGKGYYALDISAPDTITSDSELASRVLWEYPQADTPDSDDIADIGYSFSRAFIVDSNADSGSNAIVSGSTTDTTLDDYLKGKVVVFGNGYGSENGNAVLYFLNPYSGELIRKIAVGGGPGNGLSTPIAIDVNNDYKMDYLYAGDLQGNLWKFDVTSDDPSHWQVAYCDDGNILVDKCKDTSSPQPLFTTKSNQPITTRPDVTRHDREKGYMVVFGTGRFLDELDWQDTSTQAFYGIWDFGDDGDDSEYLGELNADGSLSNSPDDLTWYLREQTVLFEGDVTQNENGDTIDEYVRVITQHDIDWTVRDDVNNRPTDNPWDDPEANVGWFFELPLTGERMATDALIRDGKAILISFILDNDDRCTGGAESLIHEIDVYSGGRLDVPAFDINNDGKVGDGDRIYDNDLDDDGNVDDVDGDGDGDDDDHYPPSATKRPGRLQAPAIVEKDDDTEIKLFSSSDGTIQVLTEEKEKRGVYYWREN